MLVDASVEVAVDEAVEAVDDALVVVVSGPLSHTEMIGEGARTTAFHLRSRACGLHD